jgi:hypothetical protein
VNNIILPKSLIFSLVGVLLVTFSVFAGTSILEGVVKDATGRPIKGADVRIEAKNFSKILKTDASGHYVTDGLAVGTYKVTLVINGQVNASILDTKTQVGKATQLNFQLTGKTAPTKKHMVWVPSDLATHIGGGRWVEVDELSRTFAFGNGFSRVETTRGPAVQATTILPFHSGF